MDDFAADLQGANAYGLAGNQANAIAAGKRPLSSMSPTFIESPSEFTSFGTPGGSRIPSMVLLAILQYLDGAPVATWPATQRYHHQFRPDLIEHEPDTFSAEQIAALQAMGHSLKSTGRQYGNQQVLRWHKPSGHVEAASDPRGIGLARTTGAQP
jgi:gamma-glutamyltranspeptidase / glutathione hydrolase